MRSRVRSIRVSRIRMVTGWKSECAFRNVLCLLSETGQELIRLNSAPPLRLAECFSNLRKFVKRRIRRRPSGIRPTSELRKGIGSRMESGAGEWDGASTPTGRLRDGLTAKPRTAVFLPLRNAVKSMVPKTQSKLGFGGKPLPMRVDDGVPRLRRILRQD